MNFYHGLLLLAFCGLGLLIAIFIRNTKLMFIESSKENVSNIRALDFENDIVFIDYIIDNLIIQEITKMEVKNHSFNNVIMKTLKAEISMRVYKSLSKQYRDVMYTYFSQTGFNEYIISKIEMTLEAYAIKKN